MGSGFGVADESALPISDVGDLLVVFVEGCEISVVREFGGGLGLFENLV
jgi:hypothetical protein